MIGSVSLKAVRAFEAVARLGSFKQAAGELNLTSSAVSHAVIGLERSLGVGLIDRTSRRVRLTDRGETFYRHVHSAFEQLRQGLEETSARAPRLLRLHSAPSFAAGWLSPRLPRFLARHPDIEVRLSADPSYCRFTTDDYDADIVYGPVLATNVEALPIARECLVPMCAPKLARSIESPADLLQAHLIQSENRSARWSRWFEANGIAPPRLQGIRFDRSFLAIAAAADGLGVALESVLLAGRELESGRLVMPLLGRSKDIDDVGHHLVFPKREPVNKLVAMLIAWIGQEIRETASLRATD